MDQQYKTSRFLSIHLFGSIDIGHFESCNDVYLKYSIVSGPDWVLASGSDVGITQISRYKKNAGDEREFVWNHPITISYRSYNYFGWPQIVLSLYYFDTFGNDRILGYGCAHLPCSNQNSVNTKQSVTIYVPQSTSTIRRILSWIMGKKPELLDSNLFTRADCRSLLQLVAVGEVEMSFNMISKDVACNGYLS
jgi:B9 domain-containing protein 1